MARARVSNVLQFDDLTPHRVGEILSEYGSADGITLDELSQYRSMFQHKRYCVLVFLDHIEPVEPFQIDKTGYGLQAAWLSMPSVEAVRL